MINKKIIVIITVLLSSIFSDAEAAGGRYFFEFSGGVGIPGLRNLSDELSLQEKDGIPPGISASVSLGRSIMEDRWSVEARLALTRYPSFSYANEFQEFEGPLLHYGFYVVVKRNLRPGKETFVPRIGAGIGYGKTELSAGKGMIDGPQAMILMQIGHRIKPHIDLFAEAVWTPLLREEAYTSPFSVESDYDGILDSNEKRMSDGYSSMEFRIGIKVSLKPQEGY